MNRRDDECDRPGEIVYLVDFRLDAYQAEIVFLVSDQLVSIS
jgi:hypothetical protein